MALAALLGLALHAAAPPAGRGRAGHAPAAALSVEGRLAASPARRVVVVALGTAQDGGVPQPGCNCERCVAARRDPSRRRHVASLALVVPGTGHAWLVDATPDLGEQLEMVRGVRRQLAAGPAAGPAGNGDRRRPVDGILLTHAHLGHYLGLAWFGYEAIASRDLPVYASARMAAFLRGNGPWSLLVARRNVELRALAPGATVALEAGLAVTPLAVPHRDELSDTFGFIVRGPRRTLLYVPDTDSWSAWARPLPEVLARERVDVALLDGTFWSAGELPDRDVRRIGHPLMPDTVRLLRGLVSNRGGGAGRGGPEVFFTHLNHSNPALDPTGPERRALAAAGLRVLEEGQELEL